MVFRIIGGILGLSAVGIFVLEAVALRGVSEFTLTNLFTGILLLVYAFGGKAWLSKIAPSLTRRIGSPQIG